MDEIQPGWRPKAIIVDYTDNDLTQSRNGTAFLSYYDPEHSLSFCLADGPKIEVSHGGAGEPVVARFPVAEGVLDAGSLTQIREEFKRHCDRWTETVWVED